MSWDSFFIRGYFGSKKLVIDTNEVGQQKLEELVKSINACDWSDWERSFIVRLALRSYKFLSAKQKNTVGNMWDKLKGK